MGSVFLSNTVHHFMPQRRRSRRRLRKEGFVAFVWGIVVLNKITHIDRVLPFIGAKPGPRVAVRRRADIHINLHDFLSVSGVSSGWIDLSKTNGIQRDHFFFIGGDNGARYV
ncbi:hypothetical protein D3C78_641100 [compost metagenome]